jgi:hypothetical protein
MARDLKPLDVCKSKQRPEHMKASGGWISVTFLIDATEHLFAMSESTMLTFSLATFMPSYGVEIKLDCFCQSRCF